MRPMRTRKFNRIVFINESLLSTCIVWMPLFTDLVLTPMNKYYTGFGTVIFMLALVLFAGIFISWELIRGLVLQLRKANNRYGYWRKIQMYSTQYQLLNQKMIEARIREIN
jgi:hypothetical protein